MTAARWVVLVCVVAAAGEVGLWAAALDRVALSPSAMAVAVGFLAGPPVFLALVAWRRRARPGWVRRLLALAVVVAAAGLGVLGWDCYRFHTDAEFRKLRNMNAVVVPLGQWLAVLAAWLLVVAREAHEKRTEATPPQPLP